jgi:hypothetical protein
MKEHGRSNGACLYIYISGLIFFFRNRFQTVMEEEGMDEQSGFRANRGTIDSLFTTSIGLQKRKEHNLKHGFCLLTS